MTAPRLGLAPEDRLHPRHWRLAEERVIAARYPAGGTAACLPLLPHRSKQDIRQRAHLLRIRKDR